MGMITDIVAALIAKGAASEIILAAVSAAEASQALKEEARLEAKRAGNAERQRRARERNAMSRLSRDVTPVTRDTPPNEYISNPPLPPSSEAKASSDRPKGRAGESEFLRFKAAFPKRKGHQPWQEARKRFNAAVASGAEPEEVIAAAGRYAAKMAEAGNIETPYVKTASSWLNQRSWLDYPQQDTERPPGERTKSARELELEAHYTAKLRQKIEQPQAVLGNGSGLHHQAQAGDGGEPDDGDPAGQRGMELMGNLFPFPVRRTPPGVEDGPAEPVPILHGAGALSRAFR
jgi:hypothetical protein